MGLERVIEHERVALKENAVLTEIYQTLLTEAPAELSARDVATFLELSTKAEQEQWLQRFL